MKFSAAAVIAAAAAGVSAHGFENATYVTEVVTAITTFCPAPTEIVHGSKTYTVTEATTLTISDCPCTVSKPVYTSKVVECGNGNCGGGYANSTKPAPTKPAPTKPQGTGSVIPTTSAPPVATAGAGKLAALSGAGLAGMVGLAAFIL